VTFEQAMALCAATPEDMISRHQEMDDAYAIRLREIFPEFNWRVFLNRAGRYTRWQLTVDDKDPREHYVPAKGECICCGKTAAQLRARGVSVEERKRDDD
jgi:hypothetical protein